MDTFDSLTSAILASSA
uniref:Uncharacterized protein n=1 Tax=Arundo donax TaxID=35708 RepID=A0A0A9AIV3_ARUDO